MKSRAVLLAVLFLAQAAAQAQTPAPNVLFTDTESLLPPAAEWSGPSESLVVPPDDPWITPAERMQLAATPDYDETVAWLRKLVAAAPELEMVAIGRSLEGRDIWMVIASADGAFTADAMRATGKPLLLAHAGIHAGEIDGKDAGLMLLRDMTVAAKSKPLLEKANFLFIPILNVDGHERHSAYNRINQRGPREMGWRTNSRNQNLNRDFTKLDTEEVRALVGVFRQWRPDLYLDLHVTDGVDYQYDITFGGNGRDGWSPAIGDWIEDVYRPAVNEALLAKGHEPGFLFFAVNNMDMQDGFLNWVADPRYSNGYGDAIHLPAVLVENHSLKPYKRRVLGTYVLLAESLALLGREKSSLQKARAEDERSRPPTVPLVFAMDENKAAGKVPFKAIGSERYEGTAIGGAVVRWDGKPLTLTVPEVFIDKPEVTVETPAAYVIPPAWRDVAERIALHGVEIEMLEKPLSTTAEIYRLPGAGIAKPSGWTPNPFEGHVRIDPGVPVKELVETTFPRGSYRIGTDQPLGELAVLMLEPQAPDSFLQWGFFLEIFTRTEYAEAYVMEPLARKMLDGDAALKARFEEKLADDAAFAGSQEQRLMWFYEQTPYYDARYLVYPVARIPRSDRQ